MKVAVLPGAIIVPFSPVSAFIQTAINTSLPGWPLSAVAVPTLNFCTKCWGSPELIHDPKPDCHPVSVALMPPELKVALIRKLRGSLMCLVYCFDMLSMGVCTTTHWQTSGRLVQELNSVLFTLSDIPQLSMEFNSCRKRIFFFNKISFFFDKNRFP